MAIGMTYDEYWYGEPMMVRAYYKADKLRREREDEAAWLNGLYMLAALNATIGNIGNKGKPNEYPNEPIASAEKRKREQKRTEREEKQEALWAEAWMSSMVQAGKNWGKDKKG